MFLANYFNQRGQYFHKSNNKNDTVVTPKSVEDVDVDDSNNSDSVVVHNDSNSNNNNNSHSGLFDSSLSVASSLHSSSSSSSSSHHTNGTNGSYRSSNSNSNSRQQHQIHKKNRKIINRYLKRIGRQATNLDGTDLIIDEIHGCCYIPFRKFLIVIRHTSDEEIQFDTMVFDLQQQQQQQQQHHNHTESIKSIIKTRKKVLAMEVRNVCVGSSKSTIRIVNDDEVHLYNSHPMCDV